MALVSYGSSDSSDCSDLDDQKSTEEKAEILPTDCAVDEIPKSLFQALPKPAQKIVKEEDDEFLHKHEAVKKERAKITIPSLSDFKDVDLPAKKAFRPSGKKCGLLSMLPDPKFSSSSPAKATKLLIPDAVKQKMNNTSPSNPLIPDVVKQKMMNPDPCPTIAQKITGKTKQATSILGADYSDSDEGDSEMSTDFFSFNSQEAITSTYEEPGNAPPSSDNLNEKSSNLAEPNGLCYDNAQIYENTASYDSICQDDYPVQIYDNTTSYDSIRQDDYPVQSSSSSGPIELDDEAIRQLCGTRKRHRKEAFEVINVDQNQVLSNAHELLMKNLMDDTTPRVSVSKLKGNGPTGQEKRKHQITYLAHQAKVNEAELQNQWAQNRMTKRQTQSKYGF